MSWGSRTQVTVIVQEQKLLKRGGLARQLLVQVNARGRQFPVRTRFCGKFDWGPVRSGNQQEVGTIGFSAVE